ncbi:hypothetical protein VA7868_00091 [Vibrio aerogenes CECT 7868]|uniref:Uncharacterized protein n=1 Tax=Vibrio aerogenes CECT 7868 TaxID=1216006 RepID=A0A1M5UHH6_9VIBR|nr:hypothetical protein [Vibrio aerogenes]SHH62358.1 hypothetical protein VA7868_00091 [Vibrio aerogenes CECT 7868]
MKYLDAREFDLEEDAKSFEELFSGVSHEDNFIDDLLMDLSDFEPDKYKSFMILYDYKYEKKHASEMAVFVGNYRYQ